MKRIPAFLVSLFFAGVVCAQAYPNRPVKVIVPWPPGQATDISARVIAQKLQEVFNQSFVVENRPGASGMIGTTQAARSAPDGYTLLAASSGPITITPVLQKPPYDVERDFAPISLLTAGPYILVTNPAFPAANAKEFVALLRANPDRYTFSSSGTGATAHLVIELFNHTAGLKARHVPYKGSAPGLTDIAGGQIDYSLETVSSVLPFLKSGRLKAHGVSSAGRSASLPEVPPLAEAADLPGFEISGWIGYMAPAGTPREIVARLSNEIQKAVQAPDTRERYLALGLDAAWSTPEEMARILRDHRARYGDIVRKANIRVD